jgi:predicted heme/steroid binding protein
LTPDELKLCDGKNGRPAFIAYNGKVYDVSDMLLWGGGDHFAMHQAGLNVSEGLSDASRARTCGH